MLRLILKVARLIGLDDTSTIALGERFADQFVQLERAIAVSVDRQRMLPDRFLGTIAFNDIDHPGEVYVNYVKDTFQHLKLGQKRLAPLCQ